MLAAIIVLTIFNVCLANAVGFLVYRVSKLQKDLTAVTVNLAETTHNLEDTARCVLSLAKLNPNIDVVEEKDMFSDFTFPGKEGF